LSAAAAAVPSDDAIVDPRASSCGAFDRKPRLRRIPRRVRHHTTRREFDSVQATQTCRVEKKEESFYIFETTGRALSFSSRDRFVRAPYPMRE
jgi:hypothetical protein